ncbi:MAG: tetratricopeptide repeat protein [Candidatus Sabulitectum sp.]|nr:tetratricopeptide repeat protein [Candidatus Sabulitectum sp.]
MYRLIPSFICEQFEKKQFKGEFPATTMFIDIAGFTAMTQTLMDNGKEGAEVLADVINAVFKPAIDAIFEYNGFVSSFAGDAFAAIFPSDSVSVPQALSAAVRLRGLFLETGEQQTKFGLFNLSVRIGLSNGLVSWGIISQYLQNSYHFGGEAIMHSAESEQNAASGEVVVDDRILSQIQDMHGVICKYKNDRFHTLLSAQATADASSKTGVSETFFSLQSMFVPEDVLSLTGRGEFRDIVSCFISFDVKSDLERGTARVITLAHSFGGYFNKIDISGRKGAMLVLFGAPVNPGNLYNRALNFALAVREIPELTVRIGLTYGTAFTGFIGSELCSEYTALGSVVNLSARFTEKKKQAVIYLDNAIYKQTHSQYEIRELKPGKFKGFAGRVPVYRLMGKKKVVQSSFSEGSMVGRDSELDRLTELIRPLNEGEFGGIVYVYGNPGIGKSRLVHELIQQQGIRTVTMQTDSILKKPLNPITYFFNNYFESGHGCSLDDRRDLFKKAYRKLIRRIERIPGEDLTSAERLRISMDLDRVESIIGALVGLFWNGSIYDVIDPQDRAIVTEQAIKEFFKALSLAEPIILLIEDIQWLDSASQNVFKILTRRIENYPLIILACSRFNDDGSRPVLKVDDDVLCYSITLEELPATITGKLIEERLGEKVDGELADYIQTRTEGNPFYTEQFCLYLQENYIIRVLEGQYHLVKEPAEIPTDINMILIARIDRLSAELKETVQIASVLGREFKVQVLTTLIELMQAAADSDNGILRGLIHTDVAPLITELENERIWSALSEIRYIFNHALLRDAVYDMQLRTRLRALHKLAGDAIVKLNPDSETTFADCAFHYEQAENWESALEYCTRAGEYFKVSVRYDEALIYCQKALSIRLTTLGEKHPDTAASYNSIGWVYHEKAEYDTALSYHEKALAIRECLLGKKHSDTAESYNHIGEAYLRKGEYDTALAYHVKALDIRKELFGEKNIFTATSYSNIGEVHWKKGNFDKALKYHDMALAIREELLGERHPSTATSYNNIGLVYSDKGDYDTALVFYEKALAIQKELLGEKHPDTAASYSNIGVIHWRKRDYDTALYLLERALCIQKELLGEKHWCTATSYNNIGSVHYERKDYDTALVFYDKALAIQKELLGEKHWYTAISYGNIGSVHYGKSDYSTALAFYEKALAVQKEQLGEKHPETAISYYCIGMVYRDKGDNEMALGYLLKALSIQRELLGEKHPYTTNTLNNIGVTRFNQGDYGGALTVFEEVLAIRKGSLEKKDPSTAMSLRDISSVYVAQEKYEDAKQLLKQALSILIDSLGEDHSHTIKCRKSLAELYDKTGNKSEAKRIREEMNQL